MAFCCVTAYRDDSCSQCVSVVTQRVPVLLCFNLRKPLPSVASHVAGLTSNVYGNRVVTEGLGVGEGGGGRPGNASIS
jgi:hypothetical protein